MPLSSDAKYIVSEDRQLFINDCNGLSIKGETMEHFQKLFYIVQ